MKEHEAIREELLDLAYGELSRRRARAVERHLEACPACRGELARIRETRAAMSALGPVPAPEEGERVLLVAAQRAAERTRERGRGRLLPAWAWAGSIGTLAVAAVVAVTLRLGTLREERRGDVDVLAARTPEVPAPPVAPPSTDALPSAAAPERELVAATPAAPEERKARRAPLARPERAERLEFRDEAPAVSSAPVPAGPPGPAPAAAPEPAPASAPQRAAAKVAAARDAGEEEVAKLGAPGSSGRADGFLGQAVERKAAASAAASGSAEDPVAAWERLAAAGLLDRSTRTFDACPEEQAREIDLDPSGRLVRLATLRASAGWVEQFYRADGTLAAVRFGRGEPRRIVRLGPGEPPPGGLPPALVRHAAAVSLEAAPRCR
ncbi:MAG TPA: zf-HC2 domain-containing protein [Anaeromyxobacteraceae bacterium]|nr:zf-HC2 domain-containing protein [Anaeromyxobacteraceae bacterium]